MKDFLYKINLYTIMFLFFCILSINQAFGGSFNEECEKWDYECRDSQILISYLQTLSHKNIGNKLNGVRRAEGGVMLRGYVYLGKTQNVGKGVHLYIFKCKNQHRGIAWIDDDGVELPLPICLDDISQEPAFTMGNEVYTYGALKPGHGVVELMCIETSWLEKLQ